MKEELKEEAERMAMQVMVAARFEKDERLRNVLYVATLLIGINMPYDIIRKTDDFKASTFRHLGKSFGFGLVLEGVSGKVDTCKSLAQTKKRDIGNHTRSMYISLHKNADTANSIKLHFFVLIGSTVTQSAHVLSSGVEFFVAFDNDSVHRQGLGEFSCLVTVDPRVVVNYSNS